MNKSKCDGSLIKFLNGYKIVRDFFNSRQYFVFNDKDSVFNSEAKPMSRDLAHRTVENMISADLVKELYEQKLGYHEFNPSILQLS